MGLRVCLEKKMMRRKSVGVNDERVGRWRWRPALMDCGLGQFDVGQ